jgi:uncharacterized protein (DUF3084 family)
MAYKGKTLRRMLPVTRKLARLAGEAGSLERRLKNLVEEVRQLELDSKALETAKSPALPTAQTQDTLKW